MDATLYTPASVARTMLPIVEQLLLIQERDRRIAQLKHEKQRLPGAIAEVDNRIAQESARLEAVRNELKHLETERKKLEIDAESKRAQIVKYRTQLSLIKSNTEYQALLKEIAKAQEEINEVEDHELEFMEKSEQLQPALKEEQATLKELTGKAEGEKQELRNLASNIEKELGELQADRERLSAQIDADALSRYDRLMRSKGDAAIVPIRGGNCGGCHLQIPPQLVHDARHNSELTSCSYCGRILYSAE